MKQEVELKPTSGWLYLGIAFLLLVVAIAGVAIKLILITIPAVLLLLFIATGFYFITPNSSRAMLLFGEYKGTVKDNGLFWINPFYSKREVSLRARNFDSDRVKVNDKIGNPIQISVIMVWRVKNTYRALFEVDNYESFVHVQCDAAVRKMAGMYPYDNFEDEHSEITLRSGLAEVNEALEHELAERLTIAGIEIIEARIGYLAYAEEIAQAMLKRQQATAIVAALEKIVEGAVGMVDMALQRLSERSIVELDEERKAAMVSNLMVVLCSDKDTTPVVNTGTLNH